MVSLLARQQIAKKILQCGHPEPAEQVTLHFRECLRNHGCPLAEINLQRQFAAPEAHAAPDFGANRR
jgi:hypothetical protein